MRLSTRCIAMLCTSWQLAAQTVAAMSTSVTTINCDRSAPGMTVSNTRPVTTGSTRPSNPAAMPISSTMVRSFWLPCRPKRTRSAAVSGRAGNRR